MNKVVLLAPTPPPIGGIATWTLRMMNSTLPHNWKVEVVDEKIIGKREFFGDRKKLEIKFELIRCFRIWNGLKKALKDPEVKIVQACIAANTLPVMRELISAIITRNRKRKFIINFRCTVPNSIRGKLNKELVRILCNKSDCIMLLNKQSEDYIKKLTKRKTIVIPNFVEAHENSEAHEIRSNVKRVVYVGGVVKAKGCIDIIEVAREFPNIEFKLIGNPEEECIRSANKVKNVTLTGAIPHADVIEELKEADIFLFLTHFRSEGFSNSLAEAMAMGLPCIVSDWASNRDMIEDKGGVVVPIKDKEAAVNALNHLLCIENRKVASSFNINKVRHNYIDTVVQNKYVMCYEELVDE